MKRRFQPKGARLAVTLLICAASLSAQGLIVGSTKVSADLSGKPLGVWSGGALLTVNSDDPSAPEITAFDRAGKVIQKFVLKIPGAVMIHLSSHQIARRSDGSLALAGSAFSANSQGASFLAIVTPDNAKQTVVQLSPYSAFAVTIASDGTIWTAGRELISSKENTADYAMIRRFDISGRQIGSLVNRSNLTLPPGQGHPAIGSYLASGGDRIGWYSYQARVYIEFGLDGREIARYQASSEPLKGLALCADDSVAASSTSQGHWKISSLDRPASKWQTTLRPEQGGFFYGCDNNAIASVTTDPASISWLSSASLNPSFGVR